MKYQRLLERTAAGHQPRLGRGAQEKSTARLVVRHRCKEAGGGPVTLRTCEFLTLPAGYLKAHHKPAACSG